MKALLTVTSRLPLAAVCGLLALGGTPGLAQERGAKVVEATGTGTNFCLGCTLKKEDGAGAQCDVFGHRHALRVTQALVDGKEQPAMTGWVLHYLETTKSEELIKKHHGKSVTVVGKVYPDERVLEVASFQVEPAKAPPKPKPEHPEHPK